MPKAVMPWFTALSAYSKPSVRSSMAHSVRTNLHQLAATKVSLNYAGVFRSYLGENVVNENEYRSAILSLVVCGVNWQRDNGELR